MDTRRSFLKAQFILGSSVLFASGISNVAKAAKVIYTKSNANTLNLLSTSNVEHIVKSRQAIKNFEMGSINLFSGSIANTNQFADLTFDLSRANYHAVNFSWKKNNLSTQQISKILSASSSNFVNCNYTFKDEKLQSQISPYIIVYSGNTKIGITGIGAKTEHTEISYQDPITALNKVAKFLKTQQNCDKVICLADLGFNKAHELNNLLLAQTTAHVDVIVGAGENPNNVTAWSYRNTEKQEVLISANKDAQRVTNLMQLDFKSNNQLFNTKNL